MTTPFDFNALLQDPTFQFGASLFGNARQPGAAQSAFGQMAKVQQFKATQQQQQQELEQRKQWQAEQSNRLRQQNVEDALRTGILDASEKRKQDLFERQTAMQDKFMQQLQGIIGGGQQAAPQQPQDGAAPEASAGPQSQGQGGPVTPQILDSLAQVESSGNPNAVNPDSGAQGLFQFMPATAKAMGINPFDPQQARQGAEKYLNNLTTQNGGSLERALAAYGGFKTKDPSGYIQKVMAGAGAQPQAQAGTPGGPVNMSGGMPNRGLDVARLAAGAGVVGLPGAAQVAELGKMMAPQNVAAGSYQRDPTTGRMQYIQDPMRTAELAQGEQRIGMEGQKIGLEAARQQYEQGGHPGQLPQKALDAVNAKRFETADTEINKSHETYKELPNQFHALERAQADVAALIKNKSAMTPIGFAGSAKLTALKVFSNTFGYAAPESVQKAEDFNSAMAQLWMKAVKQVDQNPTANQQKSIMASFGTLQNDPKALEQILAQTKISFSKQMQRHNKAVAQFQKGVGSPDPYSRYLDTGETTPAGTHVGEEEDGHTYLGGPINASTSWTN